MKHSALLITTADALRHVFFPPSTLIRPAPLRLLHSSQPQYQSAAPTIIWRPSGPSFPSNPNPSGRTPPTATSNFGPKETKTSRDNTPIRDEEIASPMIRLVQSDNSLSDPTPLETVLAGLNRRTHFLQQVSPATASIPQPICKIMDKAAAKAAEKDRAKQIRSAGTGTKRVEIAWGIDKHDLEHKIMKMAEICEMGRRVEVILGGSRRKGWNKKKAVEEEEGKEIIARIREGIKKLEGGKEWKAAEGEVGKVYTLFVEGKRREKAMDTVKK